MNKYFQLGKYFDFGYRKIAPLLSKVDHLLCAESDEPQPIFLLGVPRSGTTLTYQLIVHCFDLLYVSNLVERFYATPNLAFAVDQRLGSKGKPSFTSSYGKINVNGIKSPNQGVNFFYQFFGLDDIKHHQTLAELDLAKLSLMRKTIGGLTAKYKKQMVFKELSLGQKIPVLQHSFPYAKYILIERNLLFTAQSIHRAMTKNNHPEQSMWGGQFDGFEQYLSLNKNKLVANQVVGITRGIEQGLEQIDSERVLRVNYKDICLNASQTLGEIADFIDQPLVKAPPEDSFNYSEEISIDKQDFEQIRSELIRLTY